MKRLDVALCLLALTMLAPACRKKKDPGGALKAAEEEKLGNATMERIEPEKLKQDLEERWAAMQPPMTAQRTLVHQGLPSPDRIVLWASVEGGKPPTVSGPGSVKKIELGDIGYRIEITGLSAGKEYEFDVSGVKVKASTAPGSDDVESFSFVTTSCNSILDKVRPFKKGSINQWNLLAKLAAGEMGRDGSLPDKPSFGLGLGDQIYVDAGAYPLFEASRSNEFHFDLEDAPALFDLFYRYNFAIPPADKAFRVMPWGVIWDDHEIRDGWGSQGDESDPVWQDYFAIAKEKFRYWQQARNPDYEEKPNPDDELVDFTYQWGKKASFFVIDSRTDRRYDPDNPDQSVGPLGKGDVQLARIQQWLEDAPDDVPMLMVLGTPIPLSLKYLPIGKAKSEFKDDIRDGWHSDINEPDANALVKTLVEHFSTHEIHRLLVLSGDVHESGLFWLELGDGDSRRIFGHEVISSGITSAIPGPDFLKSAGEVAGEIGPTGFEIHVSPRSSIRAPSFAEIVVQYDPRPQVGVIFWTSGNSKDRLVNWAADPLWDRKTGAVVFPESDWEKNYTITWLTMDAVPDVEGKAWISALVPGTVWDYSDSLHGHSVKCEAEVGDDENEDVKYDSPAQHWYEVYTGAERECEPYKP